MSHDIRPAGPSIHGIMAEYDNATSLVKAIKAARAEGFRNMDAYTPVPVHEAFEALECKSHLQLITLLGGLAGCFGGFFMQYYAAKISFPINIGGRPLNSWPMFIPITFELTILISSISCVVAAIVLNNFPEPYHPVFNVPRFERATTDGFFLCIEATDKLFDEARIRALFQRFNPREVSEVAL